MARLSGKTALVTGGAGGMGMAHVRRFVAEGAKVCFVDLLDAQGTDLANELGEAATYCSVKSLPTVTPFSLPMLTPLALAA